MGTTTSEQISLCTPEDPGLAKVPIESPNLHESSHNGYIQMDTSAICFSHIRNFLNETHHYTSTVHATVAATVAGRQLSG